MDKIIKRAMSKALSDDDLKNTKATNIVLYKDLKYIDDIDMLFNNDGFILLYPGENDHSGHWTTVLRRGNIIEMFDSYGLMIDDQLKYSSLNYRPYLTELILRSKNISTVECNKMRLQSTKKDIATCGRWALIRLLMKHKNIAEFTDLFKNQKITPDEIVTYLTMYI
jgi:hypothetical protein